MRRILFNGVICLFLIAVAQGQDQKPWTEWTKKEAEKTLNDSAWAQTQVEGESPEPGQTSAITQVSAPRAADRQLQNNTGESGEAKTSKVIKYKIRLFSAKPIRQGFARMLLLSRETPDENLTSQLQSFVDRDFSEYIIIAVALEVADERLAAPVVQVFSSATTETLKDTTFLERKDGKRLALMEYRVPGADGIGAKFVFKRVVDGEAFVKSDSDNLRFVAELNKKVKLNTRYKLSDMMYDGKLEY